MSEDNARPDGGETTAETDGDTPSDEQSGNTLEGVFSDTVDSVEGESGDEGGFDIESLEDAARGISGEVDVGPAQTLIEDIFGDEYSTTEMRRDFDPQFLREAMRIASSTAASIEGVYDMREYWNPELTPVRKGRYTLEHFKIEHYYTDFDYQTFTGTPPTAGEGRFESEDADEDGVIEFKLEKFLGKTKSELESDVSRGGDIAENLKEMVDENTVNVNEDFDEDEFFTTFTGNTTVVNRYDLEKAVPRSKKSHFEEVDRYWATEPFAFIIIFRSTKENELKYYAIEPHLTTIEKDVVEFLVEKLRSSLKYGGDGAIVDSEAGRARTIEQETYSLLERYGIYQPPDMSKSAMQRILSAIGIGNSGTTKGETAAQRRNTGTDAEQFVAKMLGDDEETQTTMTDGGIAEPKQGFMDKIKGLFAEEKPEAPTKPGEEVMDDHVYTQPGSLPQLRGIEARPEPILIKEDDGNLSQYQVEKILYFLKRNFVGYERIDPIKNDINVEDISCDGYNSPVFAYHGEHEQLITNIYHGKEELDEFVVKMAQRSGKGISKRQPQVDCTLPDGSRAQLTLGKEVSDHGTNYTIRQFKDVPFTPIDLINWNTFSLDQMAFLWLCIENEKALIFAGGTASGKTTSLNAVSLFIPSKSKIVSIEDTREVELPQRNWIASITRPSFNDDDKGDVDEFKLLEAALRQRPDYIVMGEIRGEEGRTLFQVMSTGHTALTTFHADTVGEVIKRFTTDPINVSKTMFTALDLVSIQTATRVQGNKVRRSKAISEITDYDPDNDQIQVRDVYQWQAETDQFMRQAGSETLEQIKFDRGWSEEELQLEIEKRRVILGYLIKNRLNTYTQVAATIQAFLNDNDIILSLISDGVLEERLEDLREMESVLIDIDPDKEAMVPRPTPSPDLEQEVDELLDEARDTVFADVPDSEKVDISDALSADTAEEDNPFEDDDDGVMELPGLDDDGDEMFDFDGEVADANSDETPAPTSSADDDSDDGSGDESSGADDSTPDWLRDESEAGGGD